MFLKRKKSACEENTICTAQSEIGVFLPITLELAEVSQEIYTSSKSLEGCAKTLRSCSDEVADNIRLNRQNVGEVHHEMTEIVRAAEDINERTMDNKELSKDTLENAQLSMNDLNESIQKIEDLFVYFGEVVKTLEQLQTYSQGIANITTYIDQIAAQTSLLSLNASIEAARAGEAGRGFMVITEEIKKLANQSKDFSQNISGMLQNMSGCIDDLSRVSQENCQKINDTKQTISMMDDNLNRMIQSTYRLDRNIQGTLDSSMTIKQSVEIGQQKVSELSQSFSETMACTEKMSQAVVTQNQAVNQLAESNEKTRVISEKQLDVVLSSSLKEKLALLGEKTAHYAGAHDEQSLRQLAKKYFAKGIYYINAEGNFVEGTDEEAMGLNIFEINKDYKKFALSDKKVEVFPIGRNICTGEINRYVAAKGVAVKQYISLAFDLESMVKLNELSLEEIRAL